MNPPKLHPLLVLLTLLVGNVISLRAEEAVTVRRAIPNEASETIQRAIVPDEALTLDDLELQMDNAVQLEDDDLILQACRQLLKAKPSHVDALRETTSVYLRRKDAANARIYATRLVAVKPEVADYQQMLVDSIWLDEQARSSPAYAQALARARQLNPDADGDQEEQASESKLDIAQKLEKGEEVRKAIAIYREIAADSHYDAKDRAEASEQADALTWERLPRAQVTLSALDESSATLFSTEVEIVPYVTKAWTAGLRARWDRLSELPLPSLGGRDERVEAVAYLTSHGQPFDWTVEMGYLDTHTSHLRAGLTLSQTLPSGLEWSVSAQLNARPLDSLEMISAGGRENRLQGMISAPLGKEWHTDFSAKLRQVNTDFGRLGSGGGFEYGLQRRILKGPVQLDLRYEWEYNQLKYSDGFHSSEPESLALQHISTHRLALLMQTHLTDHFTLQGHTSAGYRFGPDTREYIIGCDAIWFFLENWRFMLSYEFNSAGESTGGGGSSSQSLSVNVGRAF